MQRGHRTFGTRAGSCALAGALLLASLRLPAAAAVQPVSIEALRATYPDLPLREVSQAEFDALTHDPARVAQLIVTPEALPLRTTTGGLPALAAPPTTTNSLVSTNRASASAPYVAQTSERPARTHGGSGNYSADFWGSGSIDSEEAAIVVFVIAGVVVVAAAVIYAGVLLYNVVVHHDEGPELWWEPALRYHYFSSGSQHGWMAGGSVGLGFTGDDADVGLILEGGYLDANMVTIDHRDVSVGGGYAMAGPTVRWPLGGGPRDFRWDMELLAGRASGYSLISRASAALTWAASGPWRVGLRFGALYLDVNEDEGPVLKAGDDFNLFFGAESSLGF